MRALIIGDVHGLPDMVRRLLDAARYDPASDGVVFVGDLLDRGPDPVGAVRLARDIGAVLVLGNHEDAHARWRRHAAVEAAEGRPNPMAGRGDADTFRATTAALAPEDVAYLDSGRLYHPLPEHGALVVHAGVPPRVDRLPTVAELAQMSHRQRDPYLAMLRVRYIDDVGDMVPLGQFWAAGYDGRLGTVYYGHAAWMSGQPRRDAHAVGIDLGAVYGGRLAAAVLTEPGRPADIVSVSAVGAGRQSKGG